MKRNVGDELKRQVRKIMKELLEEMMLGERQEYLRDAENDKGNGFYSRELLTSIGPLEDLHVPRSRTGNFKSEIIPERRRTLFDLEEIVFSMYTNGSSTRDIENFVSRVYSAKLSKSAVSRLTEIGSEVIERWRNQPLPENLHTVFLDATFIKLRRGTVKSEPVYIATSISEAGERSILGFWQYGATGESAQAYKQILEQLKNRGLKSVQLFVTDGLSGIGSVIEEVYPAARHQLCITHQMRNSLLLVRNTDKSAISADLKRVYRAENKSMALERFDEFKQKWQKKYPKLISSWEKKLDNLLTFLDFPVGIRRFIYTTNQLERLNKEIKRRTKIIESFSTEASLEKILYFILKEEADKYSRRKMPNFSKEEGRHT